MDLDLFVQCAAKITAMDGLSFQGLIFLMFLSCLTVTSICPFFVSRIVCLKWWKKSNINLKQCGIDGLHIV